MYTQLRKPFQRSLRSITLCSWYRLYHTCQPLETQMREISLIWSLQWGRFWVNTMRDLFSVINNLFTFYSPIYHPYSPIILTKYHEHCWNSDILISKLHMLQYFLSYRASMLSVKSQSGTFSDLQHVISRCIVNTGNILVLFCCQKRVNCVHWKFWPELCLILFDHRTSPFTVSIANR